MEVVIRVILFYVLEIVYNKIIAVISHPNCCFNTITMGNGSLVNNEPAFCFADQSYLNSSKTNLFHVFLISMCMIFAVTARQVMLWTIKWVSPLMIMLGSLDYFYDCSITLNKYSARMLRLTTFVFVCYWIYQQIGFEYKPHEKKFEALKWLIPLTLLFWCYDYFNATTTSTYSITALRIFTYLMVSYSLHLTQRDDVPNGDILTAQFFLLVTFGLGNAEFQYMKYIRLISLMRTILPRSANADLKRRNFLILFICFGIGLPFLNCSWSFESLMEGKCWEEMYRMESITIARVLIAYQLWPYLNKLIFEAVQYKLLGVPDFDLGTASLESMARQEFFAIDRHFLNLNNKNRWVILQICFIINFGELLANFSDLTFFILSEHDKGKKLLTSTLIVHFLTVCSACLMLGYSLRTFNFSAHLFVIICLAIYVIVFSVVSFLRYAVVEIDCFKKSVERLHWVRLLDFFMFLVNCCFYISLSVSWFLIVVSQEFVALLIYENWRVFTYKTIYYVKENISYIKEFVRAKIFMYFVSESKAEVLKELKDVCSICREEMLSACVTPCNHHFHKNCLLTCLYDINTCPLCRYSLFIPS